MKLTSKPLGILILVILFGGITFTTWMGWWQTETTKVPAVYTEGEDAGQYNPADIRGSYAFGEISTLFEIPMADLKLAFNLPGDDAAAEAFQLKSLEEIYADQALEVGTASVRLFVAWYKGLSFTPAEETYLPAEAVAILREKASLTAEQIAYLEAHIALPAEIPLQSETPSPQTSMEETTQVTPESSEVVTADDPVDAAPTAPAEPALESTEHIQPDRTITGQTTFQQVLDWGVAQADIEQVLGASMPLPATLIKDYATAQSMQFSTLKTSLQDLVDQAAP